MAHGDRKAASRAVAQVTCARPGMTIVLIMLAVVDGLDAVHSKTGSTDRTWRLLPSDDVAASHVHPLPLPSPSAKPHLHHLQHHVDPSPSPHAAPAPATRPSPAPSSHHIQHHVIPSPSPHPHAAPAVEARPPPPPPPLPHHVQHHAVSSPSPHASPAVHALPPPHPPSTPPPLPPDGLPLSKVEGPYKTQTGELFCSALDPLGPQGHGKTIQVVYPIVTDGERFPVITYTHGAAISQHNMTHKVLHTMASWGHVVFSLVSCLKSAPPYAFSSTRCAPGGIPFPPMDPCSQPCFGSYYEQQLLAVNCSQSSAASHLFPIDVDAGVHLSGHSTGAEATSFAAAYGPHSGDYRITSASLHYYRSNGGQTNGPYMSPPADASITPYGSFAVHNSGEQAPPLPRVPTIMFTGTNDTVAYPNATLGLFEVLERAAAFDLAHGLVNKFGATHLPDDDTRIGLYTVAWAKLFQTTQANLTVGINWADVIYGNASRSICGGGDGQMVNCTMVPGAEPPLALSPADHIHQHTARHVHPSPSPHPSPHAHLRAHVHPSPMPHA